MARVTWKIIPLREHSLLYRVNPLGLVGHGESHLSPAHPNHSHDPPAPAYLLVGHERLAVSTDLDPLQLPLVHAVRLEDVQVGHVLWGDRKSVV